MRRDLSLMGDAAWRVGLVTLPPYIKKRRNYELRRFFYGDEIFIRGFQAVSARPHHRDGVKDSFAGIA